jgi:hypothetical protein
MRSLKNRHLDLDGRGVSLAHLKRVRMLTTRLGKDVSKPNHYVSVNAVTLEPSEDIDLRKWHQEGWVFYVENRVKKNGSQMRLSEPFDGSMY